MWMSVPIPVMTRIISDDNGSSRSVKAAWNSPERIHENTVCTMTRDSGGSATRRHTATSDTANETSIAAQATPPETAFDSLRPRPAFTRKPDSGRSGIRSSTDLPLQRREGFGIERLSMTEQPDDDRQTDGGLGRG